ncbi:MAG: hypothetical protein JO306_10015, partial [Gemmatimonadetes bacterium]|nr:hypothetical protein [Gemmatimonadota bacterium]
MPTHEAAPPVPTIAATLLGPQDRIPRKPLVPWAASLLALAAEAHATLRTPRRRAGELGFIGNNAGLVAAHRGEMATAWR